VQMKKLLGSTLALSMLFPAGSANAELLKNFKLGGQIDLQSTAARNVTDFTTRQNNNGGATFNDRIGDTQTRIMIHGDWDILDDVHAKVTVRKNDRAWGTAGGTGQGPASNSQPVGTAGANILGQTFVDQAYFKIDKVAGSVDATFGRQFYGNSGDMVVYYGPSDKASYGLWVTAIDAVRADWSNDTVGLTVLAGKTAGTAAMGVAGQGNIDVRGLTVNVKAGDNANLGAYVWNQVTHNAGALGSNPGIGTAGGKNDYLYVAGLKGKVNMGMAWIAAEVAKNFGQNRVLTTGNSVNNAASNYTGWAGKLDLGAKIEAGSVSVSPWAHFGYGSGDGSNDNRNSAFVAISPDYRPGSIYGRFAVPLANGAALGNTTPTGIASNALSNRQIWGLGVKATPVSKLTAGVSYWTYSFATRPGGTNLGTPTNTAGQKRIGSEVDLDLTWAHSENVTLGAGAGQFFPGGFIKETIQSRNAAVVTGPSANSQRGVNPAYLGYFDVRVKF
jgi:hypothetical protein